jgi:cytochrome c oxidase subunit 3
MKSHKTTHTEKTVGNIRIEKNHPYKTFLFFGLLGSTVVFLSISFLYLTTVAKSGEYKKFHLPKAFTISTLILLFSSFSISRTLKSFKEDSFNDLLKYLVITLGLAMFFCVSQFFGWKSLYDAGFFLSTKVGVSYLYIITGLHLLHVIAGICLLIYLSFAAYNRSLDMVDSLLFFSNKYQLIKLELACIFWHFIDFIWLCLFLMFLFTF